MVILVIREFAPGLRAQFWSTVLFSQSTPARLKSPPIITVWSEFPRFRLEKDWSICSTTDNFTGGGLYTLSKTRDLDLCMWTLTQIASLSLSASGN